MPQPRKKPPTRTPTAVVKPWNSTPLPPARSGFMNRRSGGRGQRALEVMSRRLDHIEALLTLARAARARPIRGRAQGSGAHWRAFAGRA